MGERDRITVPGTTDKALDPDDVSGGHHPDTPDDQIDRTATSMRSGHMPCSESGGSRAVEPEAGGVDSAAAYPEDEPLRPGDRVEIYRPLQIDPKQARLSRARKKRDHEHR